MGNKDSSDKNIKQVAKMDEKTDFEKLNEAWEEFVSDIIKTPIGHFIQALLYKTLDLLEKINFK